MPSTLGRGGGQGQRLWGEGRGLPPHFGAPDTVDQHEDKDDEQESDDSSQAHQPGLRAVLRGCPKVRQEGFSDGAGPGPGPKRVEGKGAGGCSSWWGLGKGLGVRDQF